MFSVLPPKDNNKPSLINFTKTIIILIIAQLERIMGGAV